MYGKKARKLGVKFLGVMLAGQLLGAGSAFAQLDGMGAVVAANVVADSIINDARQSASQLLAEGRMHGNAVLVRAATELNVAADQAARLLGGELSQQVGRLSEQNRQLLERLSKMEREAQAFRSDAYDIKDALVLDLRELLAPLGLADTFFVQRVKGLVLLQQKRGTYDLSIEGTGLGIPTDSLRSNVWIKVEGRPLLGTQVQRTGAHVATFSIPVEMLEAYFKPRQMTTVEVSIEVVQMTRTGWLSRSETRHYSIPLTLALLPAYAGTAELEARYPVYEWVRINDAVNTCKTGNHHCDDDCEGEPTKTGYSCELKVSSTQHTPPTLGDRMLGDVSFRCTYGACAFSHVGEIKKSEAMSRAWVDFWVWSKPTQWTISAPQYEWREVGERIVRKSFDLTYGGLSIVEVEPDFRLGRVTGTTLTGSQIDLATEGANAPGALTLQAKMEGRTNYLIFRMDRPIL